MGDVLHALPAVTALREAHPTWKIDWTIEPQWVPLLTSAPESPVNALDEEEKRPATRPVVDRIFIVPAKEWARRPLRKETLREIQALRHALREAEYDAVLDMQGSVRSAIVARLTGCRRVIGEKQPREPLAKWLFTERVETRGQHVIEQDVELANAVAGDLLPAALPALPLDEAAEEWCDELEQLNEVHIEGRPIVLLHPGAGWGAKRWPTDRYGALAEEFVMRGGLVLVNAAPGEETLAEEVVAASGGLAKAISCTLPQLTALTKRVSLVIGGDTGPVHLACALGRSVVGIYGPTDPKRNGPYGCRFRVLRNPESRQDHSRRAEPEAGLLTILPKAVMAAAVDMMLEEREAARQRVAAQELEPGHAIQIRDHTGPGYSI